VDTQLIADGTYFVAEASAEGDSCASGNDARAAAPVVPLSATDPIVVGCGGWSKRKTLYGGDQWTGREDALLNPQQDAAKIRAFFVHPAWARRGIGSLVLQAKARLWLRDLRASRWEPPSLECRSTGRAAILLWKISRSRWRTEKFCQSCAWKNECPSQDSRAYTRQALQGLAFVLYAIMAFAIGTLLSGFFQVRTAEAVAVPSRRHGGHQLRAVLAGPDSRPHLRVQQCDSRPRPKMNLDDTFLQQSDTAVAIKEGLDDVMRTYGYAIDQALVTDIGRTKKSTPAMNEINAAQRE
jgi:GNAT superfamily N-acetyltransferase